MEVVGLGPCSSWNSEQGPNPAPRGFQGQSLAWQQLLRKGRIPAEQSRPCRELLPTLLALKGTACPAWGAAKPTGMGPETQRQSTTQGRGNVGLGDLEGEKSVRFLLRKSIGSVAYSIEAVGPCWPRIPLSRWNSVSSTRFKCCRSSDLRWSWERSIPCAGSTIWTVHIY